MAYQLLRTNVALTGNVKLCCYITDRKIERATLNPLTTSHVIIPHDINLKSSTYSRDIVSFYNDYKDIFYNNVVNPRFLHSGEFVKIVDEDDEETGVVTDYISGAKRVSLQKNGKQISILAPIFINNRNELPDRAVIELQNNNGDVIYKFSVNIKDSIFGKYLNESYKDNDESFCKSLFVDLQTKYASGIGSSTLRGWSVESGQLTSIISNLPQKIFSRDITYTEFDSYICDEYKTYKMIIPNILNLCWYFNFSDIIDIDGTNINYGNSFVANVYYYKDNEKISLADIDFNHYNIHSVNNENVLDYNHEQDTIELKENYKEHLAPTINRWSLVESNNTYVFNNYIGFDHYNTGQVYTFNPTSEIPSKADKNLSWLNCPLDGLERDVRELYKTPITTLNDYNNEYTRYSRLIDGDKDYLGVRYMFEGKFTPVNIRYYKLTRFDKFQQNKTDNKEIYRVICNGIKYDIDTSKLPKTINTDINCIYNENTRISINCVDNTNDIKSNNAYVDPFVCINLVPDYTTQKDIDKTIEISKINFIVWLPFSLSTGNIYDEISKKKEDILKKVTINKVFNDTTTTFNYRVYVTDKSLDWIEQEQETSNILSFKNIFGIVKPSFTQPRKRIYGIANGDYYKLYQEKDKSNIIISRYYGWIQPYFIPIENGNISSNDYIFRKIIKGETVNETWGKGIEVINLYNNKSKYSPYIYPYKNPEGKWFFASRISYTPALITENIDVKSYKNKTNEEVKQEILGKYFTKEEVPYITSNYESFYDISQDTQKYIVTLKLK